MFDDAAEWASSEALSELVTSLGSAPVGTDDAQRIDRIRLFEELKSAVAAAQARETAAFVASQRAAQAAAGVPDDRVGRGVAAQVGLARRISPFHAARYVGWSMILTGELPQTFAQLQAGRTSEWRAMILARETAWLSRAHRAVVDEQLAPRLASLGDRKVEVETKKLAYRLDPEGYVGRCRGAQSDRRVSLRPAPETMSRLTGFLPMAEGVAAYVALGRAADEAVGAGDTRSRGQIMADLLVQRLTGQAVAGDVPVEVHLVMTDQALLGDDSEDAAEVMSRSKSDEPAHLDGYGPIPARLARDLVLGAADTTPMWLRRLFIRPGTGDLAATETRRRCFTPAQRRLIRLRDQGICRTPYCDASIRHIDHVVPAEHGGPTSDRNGQGYCVACNHAKQAPGWHTTVIRRAGPHTVEITTPTGHRYRSRAPDPPGHYIVGSPVEAALADMLRAA